MKIRCDVCFTCDDAEYYSNVPMIFISEKAGWAFCKPYMSYRTMAVCPECRKTLETQYNQLKSIQDFGCVVACGPMGSNRIYSHNYKLFDSFGIDPDIEIFAEASDSPEKWDLSKPIDGDDYEDYDDYDDYEDYDD